MKIVKMTLHESKRVAILQWYNSFSAFDLSDIQQLSDGKYFCDIIYSVFKLSPSAETNSIPEVATQGISSDIKSIEEELKYIHSGTIISTNSVSKSDTITAVKDEDVDSAKLAESSEIINCENEASSDSTRSYNPSFVVDLSHDAEPSATRAEDVNASKFGEPSFDVKKNYEFIKHFINERYNINSEAIVAYDLCFQCSELELGKVAVLILIKVVEHFIYHQNEALNTLTLLDQRVQEDIQQCLSFLMEQKKISERELVKVLTKPAKYRLTPRKSPRASITPTRNSPRFRNSLTLTPSSEEVFTDSPLRSFLDSPQLKKVLVIKDKELQKAQENLLLEEIKAEDLKMEVNTLKKTLEEKDKEITNLKKEKRELCAKIEELTDCKACINYKSQCELANQQLKELREENELKLKSHEEEVETLSRKIRDLKSKIKTEGAKCLINAYDHLPEEIKKKDKKLKELEEINQSLSARNKQIQSELSFLINSQATLQYADEPDISKVEASLPEDGGECLGNVIEAENRYLRDKLKFIQQKAKDIFRMYGIHDEELDVDMEQSLNISNTNNMLTVLPDCQSSMQDFQLVPKNTNLSVEEGTAMLIADSKKFSKVQKHKINVVAPRVLSRRKKSICKNSAYSAFLPASEASSSTNVGALWNQRFSNTFDNNSDIRSNLCDINTGTESKLHTELGLSEYEYLAKIDTIKKVLIFLKELFKPNGTNGRFMKLYDSSFNLETDEDYLKCLLRIKESILQFQNNNKMLALRNKCCDEAVEVANKQITYLKEEIKLLKQQLHSYEHLKRKLEQKENKIQDLRKEISTLKSEVGLLTESKVKLSEQNQSLNLKYNECVEKIDEIGRKLKEREGIWRQFVALQTKTEENEEKYKRKILEQKKQLTDYSNRCKSFFAMYEKEKDLKKEVLAHMENFKNEVLILRTQKRTAYKLLKESKAKNKQYELYFEELKKKEPTPLAKPTDKPKSATVNYSKKTETVEVQNPFNLRLEFTAGPSIVPESAFSGNYSIPVEAENESITSHASRQNGSFIPCAADEPHCYLNQSTIADRDEDEDVILYNTKQRNSLLPAHLRQSFAYNCLKLVTSSPLRPPKEILDDNEVVLESRQKKRKLTDVSTLSSRAATTDLPNRAVASHDNAVAGPSGVTTPSSKSRKFKPPNSLKKLMMYRRNRPT